VSIEKKKKDEGDLPGQQSGSGDVELLVLQAKPA